MKATSKSRTSIKHNTSVSEQQPGIIHDNCLRILREETLEDISKWFVQSKMTSFSLKNEKCLNILNLSLQILKTMMVQNEDSEQFLVRIIANYKKNSKKIYQFCRCLKHFADKDYEFQFIQDVAKSRNSQTIPFYLKFRSLIIESHLNKAKKEMLISIIADQQQWFKIVKKLFKTVRQDQIIELYTDTIKYHYINIKKNQNELLNGAEIFRICQIMNRNMTQNQNTQIYSFDEKDNLETSRFGDRNQGTQQRNKEKQVKRLFQKNIVDGLESEDKELIRILSYKDNNIARLLQKKHQKMIELIADDVQTMRRGIEDEKRKYLQLWKQKDEILKSSDNLNYLVLQYLMNDSLQNEQKLLNSLQKFNSKFKKNSETTAMIKKVRESKKNKRLIQVIEREQMQKY